jgi:hypothetical protein
MANQYRKITLVDCQKFAESKNGKCLSIKYINANEKITWKCELGHKFDLAWKHIQYYNSWCPHCNINVAEEICRVYFETIFGEKFNRIRPDWLKYGRYNLELDGYCAELGIAFEHNGIQHYEVHSYFHSDEEKLSKQIIRDKFKYDKCKEENIKIIIIPELFNKIKIKDLKNFIVNECKKLNIQILVDLDNIIFDLSKIHSVDNKLKYYKMLAKNKNGLCLSDTYINYHEPLLWQCHKGHIWYAVGFSIENGTWCPTCKGLKKLTIDDAKFVATQKSGLCLSTIYISAQSKLKWQCIKGHMWEATMASVKNLGTWCPICRDRRKKITERVS